MGRIKENVKVLAEHLKPNKLVLKTKDFTKVGNGLPENNYKEFWTRLFLECGHTIDRPQPVVLMFHRQVPCIKCGVFLANKRIAETVDEPKTDPNEHKDGRPKPKFRSTKKQDKFLKQVAARHNAVFEPGPHTIEDD